MICQLLQKLQAMLNFQIVAATLLDLISPIFVGSADYQSRETLIGSLVQKLWQFENISQKREIFLVGW